MTPLLITSVQNPRVKDAAKLRDRRQREKQRRVIIDGAREITRAIAAGVEIVEAFVCDSLCETDDCRQALDALRRSSAEIVLVTVPVFAKLAFGDRDDGLVAIARTPHVALAEIKLPTNPFVAVIEGIEKPGNVGAILRSADGAGVDAVILADCRTDLFNPNCIRADLGTVFARPVCEVTSAEALAWLAERGFRIFAARVDATLDYTAADYRGSAAIVLGSEAEGLTFAWNQPQIQAIRLPMRGIADSLNVSATAAVLFYEAIRQRS